MCVCARVCAALLHISASGAAAQNPGPHCFSALPLSVQSHPSPHWTGILALGSTQSHNRIWAGFPLSLPLSFPPPWSSALATIGSWQTSCVTSLPAPLQVNSVNCNTSWKINLFMQFRDHLEEVLKGVSPSPSQQTPLSRCQMTPLAPFPSASLCPQKSPMCPSYLVSPWLFSFSFLAEENIRDLPTLSSTSGWPHPWSTLSCL